MATPQEIKVLVAMELRMLNRQYCFSRSKNRRIHTAFSVKSSLVLGLIMVFSLNHAEAVGAALTKASATGAAAKAQSTNEFYAEFTALSLRHNADLSGTAVAVRKVKAWVSPTDDKSPPTAYKIRLITWICVETEPANCPTAGDPGIYYASSQDYAADKDLSLGISYGVLAVPFKYHFNDRALTGGSTIGGYLGFTQDWGFTQVSEIFGAGLALVSTTAATSNFSNAAPTGASSRAFSTDAATATSGTTPSTSTLTGLSIAAGLLGKLGSTNTQFGVLIGTDLVEKSASYKYNGKVWLSFSVGYNFSN